MTRYFQLYAAKYFLSFMTNSLFEMIRKSGNQISNLFFLVCFFPLALTIYQKIDEREREGTLTSLSLL